MGRILAVAASLVALATAGLACTHAVATVDDAGAAQSVVWHAATAHEQAIAADLVTRVNEERAARGLRALAPDWQLTQRAFAWSEEMSRTGLRHSDLHPLLAHFVAVAENIGNGPPGTTAGALHVAWMRSDSHRHDVLAPNLERIGIGVVCAPDGTIWATQEFGSTHSGSFGPLPAREPVARRDTGSVSC